MINILIALPTAKNIETDTFKSIYNLIIPENVNTHLEFFYGYKIDQIRNLIAHYSIENNFDYVLCVDSDMVLPNDTLVRLLNHNKDIVTGIYRQRFLDKVILEVYEENISGGVNNIDVNNLPTELFQIAGSGFGCILVNVNVFRTITYPYFKYIDNIDFDNTISEDIFFSYRAKECGYNVWCDPNLEYGHISNTILRIH